MREPHLSPPLFFAHLFSLVPNYREPGTGNFFLSANKTLECMWDVGNQAVIVNKRNKTKRVILYRIKYIVLWFQGTIQCSLMGS